MSRGDLTEAEWGILKGSLPVEREAGKRGRGRPPEDNRNIINGILWRLRCGTPWQDVPEKYGNRNSIYRRFRRWSASGVWESVAIALAETMAESGQYNIDSTWARAHVSAAGGKGGFIDEFLAARGAGLPVKFIVSVMEEAGPSAARLSMALLVSSVPLSLTIILGDPRQAMMRSGSRATRLPAMNVSATVAMPSIKAIYHAENADAVRTRLEEFEAEWGKRYPAIGQAWRRVWQHVVPFFAFAPEIRKMIYTTNAVEALNRSLRKIIKT